jgi:hypothetical protein
MANITGLEVGRLTGTTWTNCLTTAELNGLASGSSIMGAATYANDLSTNLDQLVKISFKGTVGSTGPLSSGAYISVWIADLLDDTVTYGDGRLTAGTAAALTPTWEPLAVLTPPIGVSLTANSTNIWSGRGGLLLPQATFAWVIQNGLGVAFGTTNTLKFMTGNINTSKS